MSAKDERSAAAWSLFCAELPEPAKQGCFSLADHARMSEEPSSMSRKSPPRRYLSGGIAQGEGPKEANGCRRSTRPEC